MPSALLLPVVTCAVVLLVSGVAKLRAPATVDTAFTSLDVPAALDTPLVRRLVPWAEVALGAWLLLATGTALAVVAALALTLFAAYLVLVVRALRRPEPADCGCFGTLGSSRVTRVTAWRNVLLVASAALAVVAGLNGVGVIGALVDGGALAWLLATALTVAVAVLVTHRDTPADDPVVGPPSATTGLDDDEYVPAEIPPLTFLGEDGGLLSLEGSVRAAAHLLVFLAPYCSPCQRVVPLLPGWAARLEPVRLRAVLVADPSALEADFLEPARGHAWFDPYGTARRQLGVGTPGAVLVGIDGRLAGGPVSGERDVAELVEDVIAQLTEAGVVGPPGAEEVDAEVTDAR